LIPVDKLIRSGPAAALNPTIPPAVIDLIEPKAAPQSTPKPATAAATTPAPAKAGVRAYGGVPGNQREHMTSLGERLAVIVAVGLPIVAVIAAIVLLWGPQAWGVQPVHIALLVGGYLATGLGITIGYHRLFTHKSFSTGRVMTALLGILGSMATEGRVIRWVGTHRMHHQFSDDHDDPHSPTHHGGGPLGVLKGLWHAHVGWIWLADPQEGFDRYTPDLAQDPVVRWVDKLFPVWIALGLIIPGLIAWAVTGTVIGGLLGVLWGGLVRTFVVHHITWSINSVCHVWGQRPYNSHDESRNNAVFGILGMGEGWHNNHHAFPTSARHGLEWWQFDLSYVIIRGLSYVGLTWDIKVPGAERLAAKRA
jgi:stearoyl-CoA desaturase (delta-9 desaturase)